MLARLFFLTFLALTAIEALLSLAATIGGKDATPWVGMTLILLVILAGVEAARRREQIRERS